jgi:cytochrome c biogenesis protein CcmG/thiol:disulfide interchange protein DsbE
MDVPAETTRPRRSSLRTILLGAALVIGLLVVVAIVSTRDQAEAPPVAESGADLPRLEDRPPADQAFALPPATLEGFADGPAVDLADFRGEPLIVNFWATWCAPCVKEMPEFSKASAEFGDKIALLGVDVEDAPPNAEPFIERLQIDYPLAIDPRREFYRSVGNVGMPTTLLVDAEGIVRYRHTGPLDLPQLKTLVRTHLGLEV